MLLKCTQTVLGYNKICIWSGLRMTLSLSCSLSAIISHGLKMSACTEEFLSQLLQMSGQLYLLISSYDWGYNPSEQKWRCKKERVREIFPFGERDGQEYVHFSFLFRDKQRCHADRFTGTIWVTVKIQNSMLIYCIWESRLWIRLVPVLEVIFNIP